MAQYAHCILPPVEGSHPMTLLSGPSCPLAGGDFTKSFNNIYLREMSIPHMSLEYIIDLSSLEIAFMGCPLARSINYGD